MRTRALAALVAVLLILLISSVAIASSPYPFPLPTFHHPSDFPPKDSATPPFNRVTGKPNFNRPVLLIYGVHSDHSNPKSDSDVLNSVFPVDVAGPGFAESVADYLWRTSFFNFRIVPAQETYGTGAGEFGTANDGFVKVSLPPWPEWAAMGESQRNGMLLDLVDPFVDFSLFDSIALGGNNDGTITGDELGILVIRTPQPGENCGQTQGIPSGKTLDGKVLNLKVANNVTASNVLTLAHELGHATLGLEDLYLNGTGRLALGGPTCSGAQIYNYANAYERLQWGWTSPQIVTQDGYRRVFNNALSKVPSDVMLLYDPDKGTDHYFLVEYRRQLADTYDRNASDEGLVIWRVWGSQWPPNNVGGRVNDLMRPDGTSTPSAPDEGGGFYGGSSTDAWNPADLNTPQRTMARGWSDGTSSGLAVRAIGRAGGDWQWAYFDVRGPGILVDPKNAQGNPLSFDVPVAGSSQVTFPVMNTGEATDTFRFSVVGLPNGITATPQEMTLNAGQQATATVTLNVPADVSLIGNHSVIARGESTTDPNVRTGFVADGYPDFQIRVTRQPTTLEYLGDLSADYSDPATVKAKLTVSSTGDPLPGELISFFIGSQSTTAVTDSDGVATTEIIIDQPATPLAQVRAVYLGDDIYMPAENPFSTFTINKEKLTWAYAGSLATGNTTPLELIAQATEEADGYPGDLSLAEATFTLTPTLTDSAFDFSAFADEDGIASTSAAGLPVDLWTLTIVVPESNEYWTGVSSGLIEVAYFDPDGLVISGSQGLDSAGDRTSVELSGNYVQLQPNGQVRMRLPNGRFVSDAYDWIIVTGNRALIQSRGQLDKNPATLRMLLTDNGTPGIGRDTYVISLTDGAGSNVYDSGTVVIDRGNLQVSRK